MNLSQAIRKYKLHLLLSLVAIFLLIVALVPRTVPWMDEAVYIAIGKWLFSGGAAGFVERFRPLLLPLLLGLGWKAGLDPFLMGRLLVALSTVAVFYLTYSYANRLYDKKIALIASLLLSFTPFFLAFTSRVLTGILSTMLAIFALYLLHKDRPLLSGFSASCAFIARFPQALVFPALLLVLIYRRQMKKAFFFTLAYMLPVALYLAYNQLFFGSPLAFISGAGVAASAASFYNSSLLFYFKELLLQNPLFLFAIPGLYLAVRRNHYALVTSFAFLFSFFLIFPNKQLRFALIFLPHLVILSAAGLAHILNSKKLPYLLLIPILSFAFLISLQGDVRHLKAHRPSDQLLTFYQKTGDIISKENRGFVLSNTPAPVAIYSDRKMKKLRLPFAFSSYEGNRNASHIIINSCQFLCDKQDEVCQRRKERFLTKVSSENEKIYSTKYKSCQLAIYAPG